MKINKGFFVFLLFFIFGCEDEVKEIIPNVRVELSINLIHYNMLKVSGNSIIIESYGGRKIGYLGHGIIIYNKNGKYVAYDATCTHDINESDGVENKGAVAVCKYCETTFSLDTGGPFTKNNVKPKAKYPLKEYRVLLSGENIRVYNPNY